MKLINIIIAICILTTPIYGAACVETEEKYPITLSDELIEFTKVTAEEYNLDYRLVLAIMYHESRFEEYVYNYNKTCIGLMQVTVKYQSWLATETEIEDLDISANSEDNISAGIWILSDAFTYTDDIKYALMMYNRGVMGAINYMKKHGKCSSYAYVVYEVYEEYCRRLDK